MSASFFDTLRTVDAIIAAGPERCNYDVDLIPLLSIPAAQQYFFSKLQSPEWLELLHGAGAFNQVPEAIVEQGGIAFPFWPAGDYLKRVASQLPELVSQIVMGIPQTTNIRVHDDVAEAMCSVPARLTVDWTVREAQWIASQDSLFLDLPLKMGELIQWLAVGGEEETALKLAHSLLAVLEDPRQQEQKDDDSPFRNIREPRARFGLWEYEQILNKNVPDLVGAAGDRALDFLCDLLDRAILLSDRRGSERRPDAVIHLAARNRRASAESQPRAQAPSCKCRAQRC